MRPNSIRDRHARYYAPTAAPPLTEPVGESLPPMRTLPPVGAWPATDDDEWAELVLQARRWATMWRRIALGCGCIAAAAMAALLW